jgi:hypothetical protein
LRNKRHRESLNPCKFSLNPCHWCEWKSTKKKFQFFKILFKQIICASKLLKLCMCWYVGS